jgi:D-sedoheptulose 7-phosphate isomerase
MPVQSDLDSLYPFLRGGPREQSELDAALLESIAQKATDSRGTNERFFADHGPLLIGAARALAEVYRHGGRMFTMGNGGSSCDAGHIAVEFLHPVTAGRPALTAINLTADIAMMTAVANDVGFDHVFLRQLVAQGRAGDALIGISTSGNSANLIAAFQKAREIGLLTIGLAGGDGGRMRSSGLIEYCLVVESPSIHRVQECHVTAYHILWDLVHTLLADARGPVGGGIAE